jgi:hypothetical protein
MAKKLTIDLIVRHIQARIQKLEWAIDRGEPFRETEAAKEELETLKTWIEERDIWRPARDRGHREMCKRLGWPHGSGARR